MIKQARAALAAVRVYDMFSLAAMSPVLRGAMSENVQSAVLDILKKIQGEIASFRSETNQRFERLEDLVRKQRRDTAGLLVMAKSLTANFTEELAVMEERVAALEARGR
ncbi:hypothetical protein [Bosea thiooxidans]